MGNNPNNICFKFSVDKPGLFDTICSKPINNLIRLTYLNKFSQNCPKVLRKIIINSLLLAQTTNMKKIYYRNNWTRWYFSNKFNKKQSPDAEIVEYQG